MSLKKRNKTFDEQASGNERQLDKTHVDLVWILICEVDLCLISKWNEKSMSNVNVINTVKKKNFDKILTNVIARKPTQFEQNAVFVSANWSNLMIF